MAARFAGPYEDIDSMIEERRAKGNQIHECALAARRVDEMMPKIGALDVKFVVETTLGRCNLADQAAPIVVPAAWTTTYVISAKFRIACS